MEIEHCEQSLGCNEQFTTTNYKITTWPKKEYEIAKCQRECPEEDLKDLNGNHVRQIHRTEDLQSLPIAVALITLEILAVVGDFPCSSFI